MKAKFERPEEVLRRILDFYRSSAIDEEKELVFLSDHTTPDFKKFGLSKQWNPSKYSFENVVLIGRTATSILVHDNYDPWLAVLKLGQDDRWRLESLNFQCTACFSTGIINKGMCCPSCAGTGWGLGDLTFCLDKEVDE
jgi:hypothetical protein